MWELCPALSKSLVPWTSITSIGTQIPHVCSDWGSANDPVALVPRGRWGCTPRAGAGAGHSCVGWSDLHRHWHCCCCQPGALALTCHWEKGCPLFWPGKGDSYFHKPVHPTVNGTNCSSFSTDHSGSPDHSKVLIAANTKVVLCKHSKNNLYRYWKN